jgi:hypothetical protein
MNLENLALIRYHQDRFRPSAPPDVLQKHIDFTRLRGLIQQRPEDELTLLRLRGLCGRPFFSRVLRAMEVQS